VSARTFSIACLTAVLLAVGCVGLFNWIVDPYGYFRDVQIAGFNANKPKAAGNDRLVKPAWAAKLKPEAVIVGGSVAEIGLPPTHRGFTMDGALVPFNLGMARATWSETYCLAMFMMRQAPLKRMVIGVSGIEVTTCPSDAEQGRADYGKLLFSRAAFDASRETLRLQRQQAAISPEGLWDFDRYDEHLQTEEEVAQNFAVVMKSELCASASVGSAAPASIRPLKAPVAAERGAGLRNLIRLALARRVELILLFYPTHVLLSEAQRSCQGTDARWNWLWQTVSIAEQEAAGHSRQIQVWEFWDYSTLNGEKIHAGKPARDRLWQDSIHFNHELGDVVFDAIYRGRPGYGAQVTVANFDDLPTRGEEQRSKFLAANPWVAEEFDEVKRRAGFGDAAAR